MNPAKLFKSDRVTLNLKGGEGRLLAWLREFSGPWLGTWELTILYADQDAMDARRAKGITLKADRAHGVAAAQTRKHGINSQVNPYREWIEHKKEPGGVNVYRHVRPNGPSPWFSSRAEAADFYWSVPVVGKLPETHSKPERELLRKRVEAVQEGRGYEPPKLRQRKAKAEEAAPLKTVTTQGGLFPPASPLGHHDV